MASNASLQSIHHQHPGSTCHVDMPFPLPTLLHCGKIPAADRNHSQFMDDTLEPNNSEQSTANGSSTDQAQNHEAQQALCVVDCRRRDMAGQRVSQLASCSHWLCGGYIWLARAT